jgi:hypothetical protein
VKFAQRGMLNPDAADYYPTSMTQYLVADPDVDHHHDAKEPQKDDSDSILEQANKVKVKLAFEFSLYIVKIYHYFPRSYVEEIRN